MRQRTDGSGLPTKESRRAHELLKILAGISGAAIAAIGVTGSRDIRLLKGSSLKLSRLKVTLTVAAIAIGQAGLFAATAPSASAVTGVQICLHDHPTACAKVLNGSNVSGNAVVLFNINGNDNRWIVVSHLCTRIGSNCFKLEDAQAPTLCLTATGAFGSPIQLKTCSDQGSWYNQGNFELGNGWFGESGDLDAQVVGANDPLYAVDSADGGIHLQWIAPGINS